ncbi:MAG: NTP transferase domain-containing protein [Bacteroides sp.]|nr:NTP transferase domain-containing protein [Bacteroides sp.]
MQIILLSGGSGSRLWPLSNDARSKQFLRLFPDGTSMTQRVATQLRDAMPEARLTVATGVAQRDAVLSQLGNGTGIVTEPSRRNTFPAICLACEYLWREGCSEDEVVVVVPCDPFTGDAFFNVVREMAEAVARNAAPLMVMGIRPTYPSAKYGYVVPGKKRDGIYEVRRFAEKPTVPMAEKLIEEGGLWNAGVFAFRLGYALTAGRKFVDGMTMADIRRNYDKYPSISFDYQVAEKEKSLGMLSYDGDWKDLGTWLTLTDELPQHFYGHVLTDGHSKNTHVFNELDLPLLCLGTENLIIAASPDGIIVSEKKRSENVKHFANELKTRPMYEERRWGTYRVIDRTQSAEGFCSLTKRLTLDPGCCISYQRHSCRDEVWTFVEGMGEFVLNGERRPVQAGETIVIPKGALHALRAITTLTFIEVQTGCNLVEEDIERFPYEW